jgi:hypothetical protein
VWTGAQCPCKNAVTLEKEQKVIHLHFHHQPFRLIFKCPACEEPLATELAFNMRKHVAMHPQLTGAFLLKKHIWNLEPVVWTGSDQYGGEQVHLPYTALVDKLDPRDQGFALTTWARRTGAEALIVEQLLCKVLWNRPTTNIADLWPWWVPTEVLGAIQKWVDNFKVPLW